jgi:hypothetical protein
MNDLIIKKNVRKQLSVLLLKKIFNNFDFSLAIKLLLGYNSLIIGVGEVS